MDFIEWMRLDEGVRDPDICKAVYICGAPGSGKSFLMKTAFGGSGLKYCNSDTALEMMLRGMLLDPKTHTVSPLAQRFLRPRAKKLADQQMDTFIRERLGLMIETTGNTPGRIAKQKTKLEQVGYDVFMVWVRTPLDLCLQNNNSRSRSVPDDAVVDKHQFMEENYAGYQALFGPRFLVYENKAMLGSQEFKAKVVPALARLAHKVLQAPLENPIGRAFSREAAVPLGPLQAQDTMSGATHFTTKGVEGGFDLPWQPALAPQVKQQFKTLPGPNLGGAKTGPSGFASWYDRKVAI